MTTLTIGRHRAIRSHRRPGPTLGQLVRTIREWLTRTEGQPETAGVTVPTERKAAMGMMPEGRWLPATTIPVLNPCTHPMGYVMTPPLNINSRPVCPVCQAAELAAPIDGPTIFLDTFTVRPYVLRSNS